MNEQWKSVLKRLPWLLLVPVGFAWPWLFSGRTSLTERFYAEGVYPRIKDALCAITSLAPFSLAEWILYGLICFVVVYAVVSLAQALFYKKHPSVLVKRFLSIIILFGILLNWFYISWGMNYFRAPLKERMGLTVREYPVAQLIELTVYFSKEAGEIREGLNENDRGVFVLSRGIQPMLDELPEAYNTLSERWPQFGGKVTRAKQVCWSEKLSRRGTAGIYIGMTAEPNINVDQPALLLPQAAAHEMAHQLGIASENEAEFSAHLACLYSKDPDVRYSGLIYALIVCGNAVAAVNPESYGAIRDAYSDAILRDMTDYQCYWAGFEGEERVRADAQNDQYLKYNAQESGIKSYGESVDLLLAYYNLIKN